MGLWVWGCGCGVVIVGLWVWGCGCGVVGVGLWVWVFKSSYLGHFLSDWPELLGVGLEYAWVGLGCGRGDVGRGCLGVGLGGFG